MFLLKRKILYGHFCLDNLPKPSGRSISLGAFFRDPVDWFGSYFFYIRRKYPSEIPDDPIWLNNKLKLHKGFRAYLGSYEIADLKFVGITEDFGKSLDLFSKVFDKNVPQHLSNVTRGKPKSYQAFFEDRGIDVDDLMADNNAIYRTAVKRYRDLCEEFSVETSFDGVPEGFTSDI